MTHVSHPTPAQVRLWMQQRQVAHTPPPTPEQVRRELGWGLLPSAVVCTHGTFADALRALAAGEA